MIYLQILFTDDEVKLFFEANGYEVEEREFGEWKPAYHNKQTWVMLPKPAVVINGKHVEARKLFDRIVEIRLKRYLTPTSLECKRQIENEFKRFRNEQKKQPEID